MCGVVKIVLQCGGVWRFLATGLGLLLGVGASEAWRVVAHGCAGLKGLYPFFSVPIC